MDPVFFFFLAEGHSEVKAHREEEVICIHSVSASHYQPETGTAWCFLAGFKLRLQEME